MTRPVRIAAAQYAVERPEDFPAWAGKIGRWVAEAAGKGATVLVFPEYAGLELTGLFDEATSRDLVRSVAAIQPLLDDADAVHADLAARHGVTVVAGSRPTVTGHGIVNRAPVFAPSGRRSWQDKRLLTRYEDEVWHLVSGGPLRVFDVEQGRIGIAVCYDCEFPLIVRAQAEAGAEMILIPSVTEAVTGYTRVRVGARARALENQCVTVQAPLVGSAPWSEPVDASRGRAGVFGPPDRGFPDDGIIAEGEMDAVGWVFADVDMDRVAAARADGGVLNHRRWPDQADAPVALPAVEIVDLR